MSKVRDKLWLWGHREGSHNGYYGLPADSRITPGEAAAYLGLRNMVMVCYGGKPEPPFAQYQKSLASLDRVVWSIVGDASSTRNDQHSDLEEVLELAERSPNIVGGIMDDFFYEKEQGGRISRYDLAGVAQFADRLHAAARPLELWVVLYDLLLDLPVRPYLELCDTVTFWTWKGENLRHLETNFARAEQLIGDKRKLLVCYMWDFGQGKPQSIEMMRRQCELGLRWLREGRIDGMIFLASCICDLDIETVEWTRDWIGQVGDRDL